MIIVFTDFGANGPYLGQMCAVLAREAPGVAVIELMADAPKFNPQAAAYLLAALTPEFPPPCVFLCVVDPGVGTDRPAVVVEADGRLFIGPGNGLFELVSRRAAAVRWWKITWRPERLSASFHGRDLFAPVAARLARGEPPPGEPRPIAELARPEWPDDLARVIYFDDFGNAMTGLRAASIAPDTRLRVGGFELLRRRTFADAAMDEAFWYENAIGLVEVAVNQGSALASLNLEVGASVTVDAQSAQLL